jgi:sterol desaturase/sphingolipid hydroxylase (fatty acid hydroxylase superfamily)
MPASQTAARPATESAHVDLAKPLLVQVGALGDAYDAWVHRSIGPHTAENTNRALVAAGDPVATRWPRSVRIFGSPRLETLSHIPWWIVPLFWLPFNAALFLLAVLALGVPVGSAFAWAAAGFAGWTLTEYVLHRFLFHFRPHSALGRKIHFLAHGIHHLDPWDPTRLVFPPLAGLGVAAGIYGVLGLMVPWSAAVAVMAGLLTGYVGYDMTHYATHHRRPRTAWGRKVKAWHLAHHHKWPDRLYGVSSPLWDLVLRTGRPRDLPARRS